MPPQASSEPFEVLTQIRDLLAEILGGPGGGSGERASADADGGQQKEETERQGDGPTGTRSEGGVGGGAQPWQGDRQIPDRMALYHDLAARQVEAVRSREKQGAKEDNRPSLFNAGMTMAGSAGGFLSELAALTARLKQFGEGFSDAYRWLVGNSSGQTVAHGVNPPAPRYTSARGDGYNRLPAQQPPPVPQQPGTSAATPGSTPTPLPAVSPPVQPGTPPPVPPPGRPPIPTNPIGQQPPLTPPATIPPPAASPQRGPAQQPLSPTPALTPPVPQPGQPIDPDTSLPERHGRHETPLGQTAPALIPGAPAGSTGAAGAQDSARLAAVLEKLVVFLEKVEHDTDDGRDGGGDETEQGENMPERRSMWEADHQTQAAGVAPQVAEAPGPVPDGHAEQELRPGAGAIASAAGRAALSLLTRIRGT